MRPELFQSNCAAGTSSIDLCPFRSFSTLVLIATADDDNVDVDVGDNVVTFIGSNGLNPKFAANFGAELFHFSPYNYNNV